MEALDPHTLLAEHGDYLFRVARRQLRSDALAEDAVQETLLAALSAKAGYTGAAIPRTWLTGILMETEEICQELGISPTNCWVLLHRARLFLRECLEINGFTGTLR